MTRTHVLTHGSLASDFFLCTSRSRFSISVTRTLLVGFLQVLVRVDTPFPHTESRLYFPFPSSTILLSHLTSVNSVPAAQ